jgi:putative ABC transport system permease protein
MFKNYLKIALRNHVKNKWNSTINVFSLAIGIACCILIFVYVANELNHDRFHVNGDHIYRVLNKLITGEGEIINNPLLPQELITELEHNFPAVKQASAYLLSEVQINIDERRFIEPFALVDSTFLSMFSFPLLAGNAITALNDINNIVVTRELADKIFPEAKGDYSRIIGKQVTIERNGQEDFFISGVLESLPVTSSFQFNFLMPILEDVYYSQSNNGFGNRSVYVLLHSQYHTADFEKAMQPLVAKLFGEGIKQARRRGDLRDTDDCVEFMIQPLSDVYLNDDVYNRYEKTSNIAYSYILIGIGLLILCLACINFITLSIGQSLSRTTEIGIRKVLGAIKKQIIVQYFLEKFLLICLALLAGYIFAQLLLPTFNQLSQKELTVSIFHDLNMPLFLFGIIIVSGLFAAGIPAFLISRIQPAGIFRVISKIGGKTRISSILVITQFFLSICLLSSTFIMSQQISFMQNKDLGFDKENIIIIPLPVTYHEMYKNKISTFPEVISVTGSDRTFTNGNSTRGFFSQSGKPISTRIACVDPDFINTLGINLIEGRNFSPLFPADKINSVLVNETLLRDLELSTSVGTNLNGATVGGQRPVIIGVVEDYHMDSMHRKVRPLLLHMTEELNYYWSAMIKIQTKDLNDTISKLKREWQSLVTDRDFSFTFMDENLARRYEAEERWSKITGFSTVFAFSISCLGLLGLVTIFTRFRTKEVGIRKVLGASIAGIVAILTKDITRWILIANAIAWPVTWYAMNKWLENYAYHIKIDWWIFIITATVALLIALLTVSWQAIRAATANPVESLRYE